MFRSENCVKSQHAPLVQAGTDATMTCNSSTASTLLAVGVSILEWAEVEQPEGRGRAFYFSPRVLGKGSFAMVKLAVRKSDGTKWAVKVIEKTSLSQEDEEGLKTEVSILQVRHCASFI